MAQEESFVQLVADYYHLHGRHDMPWRQPERNGEFDAYKILVSEMMLQQTQVARVIPKYEAFMRAFPTIDALAEASLGNVIALWVGLGYNRRAKYLWEAARALANAPVPWIYEALLACKGVGPNTAAAVMVYSYDQEFSYVETNIRTVLLHHFFEGEVGVTDVRLLACLQTVNGVAFGTLGPRHWYFALMDYGSYIKATQPNPSRRSKQHKAQSQFEGSLRQLRGRIIRTLSLGPVPYDLLHTQIDDDRFDACVAALIDEQLVSLSDTMLMLYNENEVIKS